RPRMRGAVLHHHDVRRRRQHPDERAVSEQVLLHRRARRRSPMPEARRVLLRGQQMNCAECGATVLPADRGEMVCSQCALVVEANMIDSTPTTTRDDAYTGPGGDGHGPALSVQNPVTMTTRPQFVTRDASGR